MEEKTILVIDTDPETIEMIESALESEGYTVFIASSREASIATSKKIAPSLVYINIALSGGSGLEISRAIHEIESLKHIPVVIISPHETIIEPRYTELYGIVDFIKKPFTPEELISKTIDVLEAHAVEQPVFSVVHAQEEPPGFQSPQQEQELLFEDDPLEKTPTDLTDVMSAGPDEETVVGKDFLEEKERADSGETDIPERRIREKDLTEDTFYGAREQKTEQISETDAYVTAEPPEASVSDQDTAGAFRDSTAEGSKGRKSYAFILVLLLIGVAGAGIIFYKDVIQDFISGKPVQMQASQPSQPLVAKPEPAELPAAKPESSQQPIKKPGMVPQPAIKPETGQKPVLQQPVEKTKPAALPAKPSDKPLHVQIGVFKNKENAAALAEQYKKLGYDAFTSTGSFGDRGTMHRVLVGNFKTKQEATKIAREIHEKEKISTILIRE